jgi:hypothetical protein
MFSPPPPMPPSPSAPPPEVCSEITEQISWAYRLQ